MNDIILIGAGGHAASCIDVIENEGRFRIAGLVGLDEQLHQHLCGYEIIATDADLGMLSSKYRYALIAAGRIKSAINRLRLYQLVKNAGFELPVIVSPHATVSKHARVGEGSIIMFGAMVNANATVGVNCIINSRALVEHDAVVGDHCHISTGAILNGDVCVGSNCFIGSGTLTKHGISIGGDCLIGMSSVVRHDLADNTTYWSERSRD